MEIWRKLQEISETPRLLFSQQRKQTATLRNLMGFAPGGFVNVPNTGDWDTYTTVETKLNKLTKGVHVLKLEITGDWVDLDYMNFKLVGSDESHVLDYASSGNSLPDGFYFAYDASGRLVKTVIIQNAYSGELGQGFYILKNVEGKSYSIVVK